MSKILRVAAIASLAVGLAGTGAISASAGVSTAYGVSATRPIAIAHCAASRVIHSAQGHGVGACKFKLLGDGDTYWSHLYSY